MPQGKCQQAEGRRCALGNSKIAGVAVGGNSPAPQAEGAGNWLASSNAQTDSPRCVQRRRVSQFPARLAWGAGIQKGISGVQPRK